MIPIDDVVFFDVVTHDPATGGISDADSTPTFEVFEESTDTDIGVGGNLTKRTSKTGNYRGSFTASAANGFEAGKWYSVIASATVGGVSAKTVAMSFRVAPAETAAGVPKVDVAYLLGTAWLTPGTAGTPDVNVKLFNGVSTSSVTTVNANLGTTQPQNFTGTGASALVKSDAVDVGGTAQTGGDIVGLIGTPQAISTGATIADNLQDINSSINNNLIATIGMPSDFGSGATIAANLVDIEAETDDIGVAGAGLGSIPWNPAWDAEVQSEVSDELTLRGYSSTVAGRIDAAISSRMATYTQPTGFLAATFPTGTIANTTNITAGTITTVTNLTNLPSIPANWLTAAGIAANALNGKGDWLLSSSYTAPLDAAATRAAVGLTSANLDTQLDALPTNAEFSAAMALLATDAQLVKVLAAVYDSVARVGNVLTLSNGATQTISSTGRATT